MPRWLGDVLNVQLNQRDIDFVIPRLDSDLHLSIDPFLLYKSRRPELQAAHAELVGMFQTALDAFRTEDDATLRRLIDFPEVQEIRFGYSIDSIHGTGMGDVLGSALIDVLKHSPELLERGLRHVEEMQLFSVGIAEDRVSDAAAGVLKRWLLRYTQEQGAMWGIPLVDGVPLRHIWDSGEKAWVDEYVTMPVDPETGVGVLLVPRWIVRRLPWINYQDYLKTDLKAFLGARLRGARVGPKKPEAVAISREQVGVVDAYVRRKEDEAHLAQPEPPPLLAQSAFPAGDDLIAQLRALPAGLPDAYNYQRLLLQLLNTLFEPELVDGEEQVRTATSVEIRDLVYSNNSDMAFPRYLSSTHGNLLVVFECKNKEQLDQDDINQLANYLGDPMGRCGFLVSRNAPSSRIAAKIRATYSKGSPRTVIVALDDEDLALMVEMKRAGIRHPVDHLQRKYRKVVQSIE